MRRIRELNKSEIPSILSIEEASFTTPWTHEMLLSELEHPYTYAEGIFEGGKLAGFCIYWVIFDEGHIVDIAVLPGKRQMGYGNLLMDHVLDKMKSLKAESVFLELRISNIPARTLYEKLGFRQIGVRRRYYTDNGEDAAVMQLRLDSRRP